MIASSRGAVPEFDPRWWSSPGIKTRRLPGCRRVDLGEDLRRYDYKSGLQTIHGLRAAGKPVIHYRKNGETWWRLDEDELAKEMRADAAEIGQPDQRGEASYLDYRGNQQKKFRFAQYPPGKNGSQFTRIDFGNGTIVPIWSDKEALSLKRLFNLLEAMVQYPPAAFSFRTEGLYVLNTLGKDEAKDGTYVVLGRMDSGNGRMLFLGEWLDFKETAVDVFDHEMGHWLDRKGSGKYFSDKLKGKDGHPLFGAGTLRRKTVKLSELYDVKTLENLTKAVRERFKEKADEYLPLIDPDGKRTLVDLATSDFVSEGATKDGREDFAETHVFVRGLRRRYNAKHPETEFLELSPQEMDQVLKSLEFSPRIREKIQAVVGLYRANRDFGFAASEQAAPGAWGILSAATALARRLGLS